ncbi:S9 family peptidase [Candidatus Lariskella endosymbiont of Epinotia ramella]|uniref:S9 family peptidase n=1 Tax=Candidatus Lariskella endosymbiont of Epinotia ramella TaxID=3066224 RepID=UPI0030CF142D
MLSIITPNYSIAMQTKHDSLIPRTVLFGNPDKTAARISPNGKYIGYIAPKDGVLNVYVADADNIKNAKCITNDKVRGIRSYFFAYDNKHVMYMQDEAGDENWAVYSVNIETLEEKRLTASGVRAMIHKVSQKFEDEILVQMNSRDPRWHDVYRLNIKSGETKLVYENNEFVDLISDDDLNLRFAVKQKQSGDVYVYKFDKELKAEEFYVIPQEDYYTTGIIGFNKANDKIYTIDSRDRDTGALFEVDIESKSGKLIYSNDKVDVSGLTLHPTEKNIWIVNYNYLRDEIVVIDDAIKEDIKYLKSIIKGDMEIISMSLDGKHWIVADSQDNGPVMYYKYNRAEKGAGFAEFLFANRDDLNKYKLVHMHPVVIKSRDGLDLISYLSLPSGSQKDDGLTTKSPLPMVLYVHGGPTARDDWGFNSAHQWLTNRGYAVLSVNYRGSTGFGKSFINAGNAQWAGKMHDDLIDAVDWAVQNKIADKEKVAIMGGSYGGYAALVGLTFTPDVFACAVDIVGPSSLETLFNTMPPYWVPALKSMQIKIGADHTTEEGKEFLASRSPITYVDRINKPLLIGHGANDPRVKQSESDQIVDVMKQKNIPVTYVLYPDEGHGFARPENRISFFAIAERFLSHYLGGRFEDVGCDLKDSSIEIKHGEEFLPKINNKCDEQTEKNQL